MIRNDYILRLIEQMGKVLAAVVQLRKARSYDEAGETLDQACQTFVGLSLKTVEEMEALQLEALLSPGEVPDYVKCFAAIEILAEAADGLDEAAHHVGAALRREKAVMLLAPLVADLEPELRQRYVVLMDRLLRGLAHYALSFETVLRLMQYREARGEFALAENLLYELADNDPERFKREGKAFYTRMQKQSDEALTAGDLPRAEVVEGQRVLDEA